MMKVLTRYSYLFCFILFALNAYSQSPVGTEDNYIRALSSDTNSVVMEFVTPSFGENDPPFTVESVQLGGQTFQRLTLKGLTHIAEEGKPQLPFKGVLLQIPAEAQVDLRVESKESMTYSGYRIPPVTDFGIGNRLYFDKAIYAKDAFYPQKPAKIEVLGFLRDVRVANVAIYPIQYNPVRNEVKFHRRLQITVSFQYSRQSFSRPWPSSGPSVDSRNAFEEESTYYRPLGEIENSDFQQIYRDLIVNFNPNFQSIKSISPKAPPKENHSVSASYKLLVDQDGIYRLTYRDLKRAGIDVADINPKTLKLSNKGKAVPIFVSGENDGTFDFMDYMEFQGEFNRGTYSLFGEYTTENVYWLSWGMGVERGARMAIEDANPEVNNSTIIALKSYRAVVHFEQDKFRGSLGYADEKRDFWYWESMPPGIHEYPFELHDIQPDTAATIRIMLHGYTLTEHHISAFVNGASIANIRWHGQKEYLLEAPLDSMLLKEGENTLTLTLRTDTATGKEDIVYLNWFEVKYWRAFKAYNNRIEFEIPNQGLYQCKITGFSKPNIEIYKGGFSKLSNVKIERDGVDETGGVQYAVTFVDEIVQPTKYIALTTENKKSPKAIVENEPSKLRSSLNGADYIIIVYDDFYEAVLPLAKYRSNQFRVAVVKVQDIYDEFSWGLLTPEAIRAFIRYAYHYWRPPAPSYLLLVGDASWDFRRGKNYVPAYYVYTYKWGQTATDHSYACVNGDDPLPDLFIGRITTRTKEATRAVVEKIIRYEDNPLTPVAEVAKLLGKGGGQPVLGDWRRRLLMLAATGGFIKDSEQLLRDYVPLDLGYKVARVYTDPNSQYYGDTAQLLDFWNSGSSFVHFTGHGGGHIWADSSLFTLNDVQFLSNKNRPAFVTSFTCFTGYFDDPSKSGLNEKLVNLEEGGAIAAFGSTGLGWVKGDYYMEQGLFKSLFRNGSRRIGQVIVETKLWMLLNTYHSLKVNMISLFNLLGDAASTVPLPQRKMDVIAHFVGDNSTPIAEKWMQVRGVIDDKFNGQALVEVYRDEPTPEELQIYHPDYQTTLRVKNGRFSGRLVKLSGLPSPLTKGVRGLSLRKGKNDEYSAKDITIRCYAWNDAEDEDAVGATVLRIPGKDEIDLSIFSDDIRFTTISSPEGDSSLKVKLQATIYNLGGGDASSVKVSFYSGPPFSGGRIVGTATIPSIAGGQSAVAEIDYTPKAESETIYVHIDPLNEIIEEDKTNNEAEKKLMFNSYTITPKGNLNGAISSLDGNLIINVPEGAVSAVVQLNVESVVAPGIINQPDLRYAPLPQKADGGAYRLSISDESVINSSGAFSISLTFRYDINHADNPLTPFIKGDNSEDGFTGVNHAADNLMVYRWRDDENLWEIASEEIQREPGIVKATARQLGTFSLLHNADSLPPIIQLSITDEQFAYDGVFASQTPTLSAIIEDANGVGKVKVFMNGEPVKQEDLAFSRNPSSVNSTVVIFTPTLDFGDYLLAVEASDVNGNASKEELPFKVGGELKLLNVANHPNPFNPPADKETRFTYVLTQPVEDVAIKIYSSSGRLIYQIQDAYQRQGYNEVPWDGKDKDGEDVANGVYFYKIVVKTQDGNLSRIGKLAVVR